MLLLLNIAIDRINPASGNPLNMCNLSRDFSAFKDKVVTVGGIYFYGLRDACTAKCADGPWLSFVDLEGATENFDWNVLKVGQHEAWKRSKAGERVELWVTVVGELKTNARPSSKSPCDRFGSGYIGFGHLGAYPAQIKV